MIAPENTEPVFSSIPSLTLQLLPICPTSFVLSRIAPLALNRFLGGSCYATFRLEEGTAIQILSQNMGASVPMIEQHYGHARTRDQRDELTKQRSRSS